MSSSPDIAGIISTLIVTGGGAAVMAYALFRWLGTSWLEQKFAEKLEAFRHEKAKELERFRAEIDSSLQADKRFSDRKFEAVIAIWDKLKVAQEKLAQSLSLIQSYADLTKMDVEARNEYLGKFDLQLWERREILSSSNIQNSFVRMVTAQRFNGASDAFIDFDRTTRSYELFFEEDEYEKIVRVRDCMHGVIVKKGLSIEGKDHKLSHEAFQDYNRDCTKNVQDLVKIFRAIVFKGDCA